MNPQIRTMGLHDLLRWGVICQCCGVQFPDGDIPYARRICKFCRTDISVYEEYNREDTNEVRT